MILENPSRSQKKRILFIAAIVSVGLLSLLSYHSILGYFFTGTDTMTLIETSRIESLKDFAKLFAEPLMAGSKFVDVAKFFRPISSLSYSLDYAIWGLNPFGFQLTNLLLNAFVAILVVTVMCQLSSGDLLFAWLSGLIFALHPILIESVPATDRRHDLIAAVFLLLSLWFFLKNSKFSMHRKWSIFLSLIFYILALGGKEIAVILPAIIFCHVLIFSKESAWRGKFISSLKILSPFIVITSAYLAWRTVVLGGLGGYARTDPWEYADISHYFINLFHNYFIDLLYPSDPWGVLDCLYANWWTLVIVSFFTLYLGLYLVGALSGQDSSHRRKSGKLLCFLASWILAPLLLFMVTLTFAHRSMYIPVIPFSALLAYPLSQSIRAFWKASLEYQNTGFRSSGLLATLKSQGLVLMIGMFLFSYLFIYSPVVRSYDQWEMSGRMGRLILTKLATGTTQFTQDCRVNLYNVPECLRSYEKKEPKAKDVTYLSDYSIKSWLNLCGFHRKLEVVIHSRSRPWDFTGDLSVAMLKLGKENLRAIVRMKTVRRTSYLW